MVATIGSGDANRAVDVAAELAKPFGGIIGGFAIMAITRHRIRCPSSPPRSSAHTSGTLFLGECFGPDKSRFRDALVSLVPPTLSAAEPFPGSLLSQMSALASPSTFIWSRLMDAAWSLAFVMQWKFTPASNAGAKSECRTDT